MHHHATFFEFPSESQAQTLAFAKAVAAHLHPGDLLALEGPLGSGKTCFVRGLAAGLGIEPSLVSSPTFVICQEYAPAEDAHRSEQTAGTTLVHIDAYRLSGPDELETIGWNELLASPNLVIAVEWPSRIQAALPAHRIEIFFEHRGENARLISLSASTEVAERFSGGALERVVEASAAQPGAFRCRTCGKAVARPDSSATYPFCSPRCRMADLGKWFSGEYRVSREMEIEDEE